MHRVALIASIALTTSSPLWVAFSFMAQLVASVVVSPLVAPWTDTQDRRKVMVLADLARALLVPLIPLLGLKYLPLLLVLVFLNEVFNSTFNAAARAVIPDLVEEKDLDSANGLTEFAQRFAEVVFLGMAGALVATIGAAAVFYFDAFTYLVSAYLLSGLPSLKPAASGKSGYWSRAKQGVGLLLSNPAVRMTVGTLAAAASFGAAEATLVVFLALDVLQVGPRGYGIMESVLALGTIVGTIAIGSLSGGMPREKLFLRGLVGFGLSLALLGLYPVFPVALAALFISGIFNMAFIIPARSIVQLNTPPELRARVFAAYAAVTNIGVMVGMGLAGVLPAWLGLTNVFVLCGLVVVLVAVVAHLRGGIPAPAVATVPVKQ